MTPPKKAVPSLADLGKEDEKTHAELLQENKDKAEFDKDEDYNDGEDDHFLSPHVVATVPNRTPAQLASESADETAARYNLNTDISDEDLDNPRVQVYKDTKLTQIPSGTHLHPDVAMDMLNRGNIDLTGTENAAVKRVTTEAYDFAGDAEYNDKVRTPILGEPDNTNDDNVNEDDGTHKV